MDPALAALDFAKAGAIIADMIVCCLAAQVLGSALSGACRRSPANLDKIIEKC
jgi:hypothetical protein